jgi:aminoglycoside 6'-N-acetyltransferase I
MTIVVLSPVEVRMIIRPVQASDATEWLRMRMALWPDSTPEKEADEIAHFLAVPPRPPLPTLQAAFVCQHPEGGLCGLVEVSIQQQAPGCTTNRIGYLEAWYVDPDQRGHQSCARPCIAPLGIAR